MSLTIADVEAAIAKVESGQKYRVDGFTYERPDLSTLIALRDKLKNEDAATNKTQFGLAKFTAVS